MQYLLNNLILLFCLVIISPVFAQEKRPVTGHQSVVDLKKEIEELKANQQQSLKEIQELKQLIQTLLNNLAASTAPPSQPVITLNVYGESFKGSNEARLAIIEYSDFECPFCGEYARNVFPQIEANYIKTGRVKYFFRDLPLPIHPNAMQAARADRCAGEQNKFWEMHDLLFHQQDHLTTNDLIQHAQSLHLNADKFRDCLMSNKYTDNIRRSMVSAERNGVNGTPAFFIGKIESNGTVVRAAKVIVGLESFETFKSALDEILQSK